MKKQKSDLTTRIINRKIKDLDTNKRLDILSRSIIPLCNSTLFILKSQNYVQRELKNNPLKTYAEFVAEGLKISENDFKYVVENKYCYGFMQIRNVLRKTDDFKNVVLSALAEEAIKQMHSNFDSSIKSRIKYFKNKKNYTGCPKLPNYLDLNERRKLYLNMLCVTKIENNYVHFSKKLDLKPIKINFDISDGKTYQTKTQTLSGFEIVWNDNDKCYNISIIYKKTYQKINVNKDNIMGIDLGVSNFAAITTNVDCDPFIINGNDLKSKIVYSHKLVSNLQAELNKSKNHILEAQTEIKEVFKSKFEEYKKNGIENKTAIKMALVDRDNSVVSIANKITDKYVSASSEDKRDKIYNEILNNGKNKISKPISNRIKKIHSKMNSISLDYIHKASKKIVDKCIKYKIGTVIIGHNTGWKNGANMSSKNNQIFCSMPHSRFITTLKYKLEQIGIDFSEINEAHTSKCSFIDDEDIKHHDQYCGNRVKRGLFKSKDNVLINADINASYNILKRGSGNKFSYNNNLVLTPQKIIIK